MMSQDVVPVRIYVTIFIALLVLTLTTTGIAFIDLGGVLNSVVALSIAVVKALLVILYFMHVRYSNRFTWVVAGAGFVWLLIMLVLTMSDPLTRDHLLALGGGGQDLGESFVKSLVVYSKFTSGGNHG